MDEIVISMCDRTGEFLEPWAEAGYECYAVDVQHSIRKDRFERGIWFVWGDARTYRPPAGKKVIFVAAFPPCTHVAVSGARDFAKKGGQMLRDALETFEACRQAAAWSGAPFMLENPVGILSSIPHIGKPDHWFNPYDFTAFEPNDNYTKKNRAVGRQRFRDAATREARRIASARRPHPQGVSGRRPRRCAKRDASRLLACCVPA